MAFPNVSIKGIITAVPYGRLLWSACVLVLAGNIVFYFFFLTGWADKVSELQAVYAQKRGRTMTGGDGAEVGYLKARKDVRTFVDRLPEKATFTDQVKELNDILGRNGLSVAKMTFKPSAVDVLSLSKYTTELKVAATYPKLKRLLADIQEAPGLFCIEGLSIENQSKDRENVVLSLVISMYFK
jgi:hypothetical protein